MHNLQPPPLADLLTPPPGANSPSPQGQRSAVCLTAAQTILGCYRSDLVASPDTYVSALAAILSDYSPGVVTYIADPRTGIVARSKFPPSPSELKDACDAAAAIEYERNNPRPKLTPAPFIRKPIDPAPLFWPEHVPGYKWATEKHASECGTKDQRGTSGSYYGTNRDGLAGIWTPLVWHDLRKQGVASSPARPAPPPARKKDEAPAAHAASAPIASPQDDAQFLSF